VFRPTDNIPEIYRLNNSRIYREFPLLKGFNPRNPEIYRFALTHKSLAGMPVQASSIMNVWNTLATQY
jgi:hypothetical protein